MRCDEVLGALAGAADGAVPLSPDQRAHVGGCLACQAELVRCRRMLRSLSWLRGEFVEPPDAPVAGVLASVRAAAEQRAARSTADGRRWSSVAALAVAAGATAAALTAAVLTRRHHPGAVVAGRRTGARPVVWS